MTANQTNDPARDFARLLAVLADHPGWVAFSGGVDSTLVLKAAGEVRSSSLVALYADSPLQAEVDRENAAQMAARLAVPLQVVSCDPLSRPDFVGNSPERCYLCKQAIFSQFQHLLPSGMVLLDGTNADDLGADRPGQRAVVELGVVSPLVLAGLNKAAVRRLSRWLALPNWNRPAASCLATRIPPGMAITGERLRHIEDCERLVRRCGNFAHLRVRLVAGRPDDLVVEVAADEMARADFSGRRERVLDNLRRVVNGVILFQGRDGV